MEDRCNPVRFRLVSCLSRAMQGEFPVGSLRIPWSIANELDLCGFHNEFFLHGKKLPVQIPAQGILGVLVVVLDNSSIRVNSRRGNSSI